MKQTVQMVCFTALCDGATTTRPCVPLRTHTAAAFGGREKRIYREREKRESGGWPQERAETTIIPNLILSCILALLYE